MSELRKDPITGAWVILAAERGQRPMIPPENVLEKKIIPRPSFCPFCEGNEDRTPPEIFCLRKEGTEPNGPGWHIRVVENKFPALLREGGLKPQNNGIFDKTNGVGVHEVMIEGAKHSNRIPDLPKEQVEDIFHVYRQRLAALSRDARFGYGLIFKNRGLAAGASLDHNHSQLIATPMVPSTITQELTGARRFFENRGECIFCEMIRQERENGERVVMEDDGFIVITPYASRFPFEMWILPKTHQAHFMKIGDEETRSLAHMVGGVLTRLDKALNFPPFNYVIHTTPFFEGDTQYYHWHLEILPRIVRLAGFEFGSGFHINSVSPEEAAETMRSLEK